MSTGPPARPSRDPANFALRVDWAGTAPQNADFQVCTLPCTSSTFLGFSADFSGVDPGASTTLQVTFIAKSAGVANWSVCVYDTTDPSGHQVSFGQAETTIH
jgi:hypothetical protein